MVERVVKTTPTQSFNWSVCSSNIRLISGNDREHTTSPEMPGVMGSKGKRILRVGSIGRDDQYTGTDICGTNTLIVIQHWRRANCRGREKGGRENKGKEERERGGREGREGGEGRGEWEEKGEVIVGGGDSDIYLPVFLSCKTALHRPSHSLIQYLLVICDRKPPITPGTILGTQGNTASTLQLRKLSNSDKMASN